MDKMEYGILKAIDRHLIKIYVLIMALQYHIKRYEDVNTILDKYENIIKAQCYELRFSFFYDFITTHESMCLTRSNVIVANPAWASKLILFNNSEIEDVFLITSGHEMTHIEKEFSYRHLKAENRKFVKWVNEVHADFGGAKIMADSSKERLLSCIDYKIRLKSLGKQYWIKRLIRQLIGSTHPSWQQRRIYAETGVFDKALIETIAINTGCIDKDLVNDVVNYYQEIVLND